MREVASSGPSFLPRPWPDRRAGDSPLRGTRVMLVGDEGMRELAAGLSRTGCSAQVSAIAEVEGRLAQSEWDVVVTSEEAGRDGVDWIGRTGAAWIHLAAAVPDGGRAPFVLLERPSAEM